jgi:ribulokinase
MSLVIGVDIGTQGTKAIAVDVHAGIRASAQVSYAPETPKPLWAQQWPQVWLDAVKQVLSMLASELGTEVEETAAISISSLYGGSGVPMGPDGDALYPCLIWMDRRAEQQVAWVKEHVDLDELFEETGNYVDSYYGFTKMMWLRDHEPDIWSRIDKFVPPNNWITYRLTGKLAVDHSSAGNIGGVYDLKNRRWSSRMLKQLGIPQRMMPDQLVRSQDIVGELLPAFAQELGYPAGVQMIAGGVDAAVATLAAGALRPGVHVAMMGTSMCWGFITEEAPSAPGLISMPHVLEGDRLTYQFGGAATSGAVVSWFERELAGSQALSAVKELDRMAQTIPAGSGDLLMLPYFMGERSPIWDAKAKGAYIGLSLTHTRAHMFRAALEGIGYALRDNMDQIDPKEYDLDEDLIVVGGTAKSGIWLQILSDITGYRIKTIKQDVEAPLGDALLAALAIGEAADASVLQDWVTYEHRTSPIPEHREVYDTGFSRYKAAYTALKQIMHTMHQVQE